ncbi:MAG TPA: DUF1330 domain-containing protein [Burkholderiales bacterium]|nr:DUF1330 domain-containing protein [Burkholderiales bacterium]
MSAYLIAEVEVRDPQGYDEYRKLVGPTLQKYGGKFLVRGGRVESLEGGWNPARIVVLEFESTEQARRWYASPEYTVARDIRQKASDGRFILVEGV